MEDTRRRYVHERPDPTTSAPQPREGTARGGGSKAPPTTPRPDIDPAPQSIRSSGTVNLPRGWQALNIEKTESGTIVWVERRGIGGRIADAAERGFRRWVWPYIGGKK